MCLLIICCIQGKYHQQDIFEDIMQFVDAELQIHVDI